MTGSRTTRLVCRPWALPSDLPERRPAVDEQRWDDVLWVASELLYQLSGRQWSGGGESEVRLVERPDGHPGWGFPYDAAMASDVPPALAAGRAGAWVTGRVRGWPVVALPDPPVTEVLSVQLGGAPVAVTTDPVTGSMWRTDGRRWRCSDELVVRYRHGLAPPAGGKLAAVTLAVEFAKAYAADSSCRLPKRIQTLTREGVTVGFQDTFDSLDAGRTGLFEVDAWLVSVNPHRLQRRAQVVSVDRPRLRRTL